MKFLQFIQSILVPRYMVIHRKMKVFISIIILIVCSLIMSIPSTIYLNKLKYDNLATQMGYDILKYVDDTSTNENNNFTLEEQSKYNMVRFSDLKALNVFISNTEGVVYSGSDVIDAKDYCLKAVKKVYDEEGTYVKDEISYIHIVFDYTLEEGDKTYDVSENFDKILNVEEGRFGHYLLLFKDKAFTYKDSAVKTAIPNLSYYKKVEFNFSNMESAKDILEKISDSYAPALSFTYRIIALFFVFLVPLVFSMLFSFVLKDTGQLRGIKEYVNFTAIASIPFTIFAFLASLIRYSLSNLLFKWYALIFFVYLFIIVIVVNRRPRVE